MMTPEKIKKAQIRKIEKRMDRLLLRREKYENSLAAIEEEYERAVAALKSLGVEVD